VGISDTFKDSFNGVVLEVAKLQTGRKLGAKDQRQLSPDYVFKKAGERKERLMKKKSFFPP
jgi:hypothetical protein